jgi:hypothetical protein
VQRRSGGNCARFLRNRPTRRRTGKMRHDRHGRRLRMRIDGRPAQRCVRTARQVERQRLQGSHGSLVVCESHRGAEFGETRERGRRSALLQRLRSPSHPRHVFSTSWMDGAGVSASHGILTATGDLAPTPEVRTRTRPFGTPVTTESELQISRAAEADVFPVIVRGFLVAVRRTK